MLHKLFFETKMTWKRVIVFAVLTAVFTAIMLILPITNDTSFENIGVTLESWFLFALIIILNCEKPVEAGLKTFVFFLVSQPLIYLLQVPFYYGGWEIFNYYPRWFMMTLACFPGGIIAWYVKKDNILSALILSVATGYLGVQGISFLASALGSFPRYILSAVYCFALAFIFIAVMLHNKKGRTLAFVLTVAVIAVFAYIVFFSQIAPTSGINYDIGGDHTWSIVAQNGDIGEISVSSDGRAMIVNANKYGEATVTFENESGETVTFELKYERGSSVLVNEVK